MTSLKMANSNQPKKPIWRRRSPAIPVRGNLKTSYLQLSKMHGDHLPMLKRMERPEFSTEVKHFDSVCDSSLTKTLNIIYKEHKHKMRKIVHGQDLAYKVMVRVHREKRRVQRAECAKRQEEFRDKMKSQRLRNFLFHAVAKFRENVQRQKKLRAAAAKEEQERVINSKSKIKPGRPDNDRRKSVVKSTDRSDGVPFRERKGSLTKVEGAKPEVKTAENRDRWDTGLTRELSETTMKARVLQVSKSSSNPKVFERERSDLTLKKSNSNLSKGSDKGSDKSKTKESIPETEGGDTDYQKTIESTNVDRSKSNEMYNERLRAKRTSIFDDPRASDAGWFTVGNPVPPSSTKVWSRRPTMLEDAIAEVQEENTVASDLPPLRRHRRVGVARPPTPYLKDQLDNGQSPDLAYGMDDRDLYSEGPTSHPAFPSDSNDILYIKRNAAVASSSSSVASLRNVRISSGLSASVPELNGKEHCHEQFEHKEGPKSGSKLSTNDSDLPKSPKPSTKSEIPHQPASTSDEGYRSGTNSKTISAVNNKLKPRKLHPPKEHVTANMLWVRKQEERTKKNWEKFMTSEDEKIIKYIRDRDGNYIGSEVERRRNFPPPSNKEKHRQLKLLEGERIKDEVRQDMLHDFYDNLPPGEAPEEFIYEGNKPFPQKKFSFFQRRPSRYSIRYSGVRGTANTEATTTATSTGRDTATTTGVNTTQPDLNSTHGLKESRVVKGVSFLRVTEEGANE